MNDIKTDTRIAMRISFDVAISLLLVFIIVAWSLQILLPFIALIAWGAVIAISLHTPFCRLRDRVGGKPATLLFGLIGAALVLVPAYLFAESIFLTAKGFAESVQAGTFTVPPPAERVAEWPLVGESLYAAWSEAAEDFGQFLEDFSPQLEAAASYALSRAASIGITVLMFLASTVIATVLLANDQAVKAGLLRLFTRLTDASRAEEQLTLLSATVRSVTMGVLGVAFIQALLGGLGMVLVGVPAAGVWALAILIFAVAQLPVLLLMLPIILYVFSVESTVVATVFAVWSIAVALGDAFLKPLLLGRGVDVPTLVILLGAIGGLLSSGILGLFIGAVVLTLGYKLMLLWLAMDEEPTEQADTSEE